MELNDCSRYTKPSCATRLYKRCRPLLGTFVEVAATSPDSSTLVDASITRAFAAIERIHRLLSFQDPESELSRLNRAPGEWIELSRAACAVLRLAKAMSRASGGRFNCTLGGRLVRAGILPLWVGHEYIDSGHESDIEIQGRSAKLKRPVLVTLDGIAKGYAVDQAVRSLKRDGLRSGWVNAGGDLRVFGRIRMPIHQRGEDGALTALGVFEKCAIATSTVPREPDARFPARILSSLDGVRPLLGAWTVKANSAWRADALTKVASLTPDAERLAVVQRLGGRIVT